uniref:Ribosomal protein S3 n=1 Tax=Eunotia naegelii TaxID=1458866 RepID=A0A2U9GI00_9STRA|nr:ribosomal protein S3 [Eunotia naegelii]AWQ64107.1 ribosomal protein S3 [Eunotia naegelii]
MGQKISPDIFRIEKLNNNWKSKYTENKKKEISAFFFKSLEIKNFIKRFSRFHGLAFHNCKIALSNTSLHLFVSYYTTKHSNTIINKNEIKNEQYNIASDNTISDKSKKKTSIIIKTLVKTYCQCFKTTQNLKLKKLLKKKQTETYKKTKFYNKLRSFKKKMSLKYLKIKKKRLNRNHRIKKKKYLTYSHKFPFFRKQHYFTTKLIKKKIKSGQLRPAYLKRKDESFNININKNKKALKDNAFTEHFLDTLGNFIGKKYSIFLTLKQLKVKSLKNFYSKKNIKFIKEKFNLKLYKYKKNEFFELAKRIVFISIKKKNSAQLLANFISSQLNRLKKQQFFFLKCIKHILKLLLENIIMSTKLHGIKIIVKGRLNKARRANQRTFKLSIGKISLQHIDSNINHAKATSYTSNGTFGTEVWINYLKKT